MLVPVTYLHRDESTKPSLNRLTFFFWNNREEKREREREREREESAYSCSTCSNSCWICLSESFCCTVVSTQTTRLLLTMQFLALDKPRNSIGRGPWLKVSFDFSSSVLKLFFESAICSWCYFAHDDILEYTWRAEGTINFWVRLTLWHSFSAVALMVGNLSLGGFETRLSNDSLCQPIKLC